MCRSLIPLVALLITLTIVAHDVAMTGDAHRSPTLTTEPATSHHGHGLSHANDEHAGDPVGHPLPEQACGAVFEAGPNRPLEIQSPSQASAVEVAASSTTQATASPPAWTSPGESARTRRAFLQVFLN